MHKKYVAKLKPEERTELLELTQNGKAAAKTLTHARILLKTDATSGQPGWTDQAISDALDVSVATIERVRRIYVQQGLAAALKRKSRTQHRTRRLDGNQEAHLIALTCSEPPAGHGRWTLRLLADRMVKLEYVEEISYETVRRTLKKTNSNRGRRNNGVSHRKPMAHL
jgi:transposase